MSNGWINKSKKKYISNNWHNNTNDNKNNDLNSFMKVLYENYGVFKHNIINYTNINDNIRGEN